MKQLYLILFTVCFNLFYAQNVGIGTTTPQAELDVNGKVKINKFAEVQKDAKLLYYTNATTPLQVSTTTAEGLGFVYSNAYESTFTISNPVNTYTKDVSYEHGSTPIGNDFVLAQSVPSMYGYLQIEMGGAYNLGLNTQLGTLPSPFIFNKGITFICDVELYFKSTTDHPTSSRSFSTRLYMIEGPSYKANGKYRVVFPLNGLNASTYKIYLKTIKREYATSIPYSILNSTQIITLTSTQFANVCQHKVYSASLQILPFVPFYK